MDPSRLTSRPRVFVSSVVDGFSEYREAARRGIEAADAEPILVNEDFPSLAVSSRTACLDAIDSCDYVVSVIGHRGGWIAPSGRLVIEEEYEHAVRRKVPVLVFLQSVDRDEHAARFARHVSDFVDGRFRTPFATPADLSEKVRDALIVLTRQPLGTRAMKRKSRDYFTKPYTIPQATTVRLVLRPEREEEVIDPVRLGSKDFRNKVYEIGHSAAVRLLSYERPKSAEIEGDALVIIQTEADGRHGHGEHVRIQMTEAGDVIIDANVTGRVNRGGRDSMLASMVVALEDIETVLATSLTFVAVLYDEIDPYKRHQRFLYNVALSGLDYRTLERDPQPRRSYGMSMRDRGTIVAHEEARVLARAELTAPREEISRTVTLLSRRARD